MTLSRSTLLALAVMSVAPLTGCRKKVKPVDPDLSADIARPEVTVQLAEVSPSSIPAGKPAEVELYGSGFVNGARVNFSGAGAVVTRVLDANTISVDVPSLAAGSYDVTVSNPDGTKATLRGGLRATEATSTTPPPRACGPVTVAFGFDRFEVDPEGRAALQTLASCLSGTPASVTVEGHSDERGTTEYNLALGQRRADSALRVLTGFGVSPTRLRAVSYGEERPKDRSGGESAWAANRRAEIVPEAE